ncbi:MAG: Wadjet anti-phage system protein JetA family protein [Spirochaetaceae bacterium]
MGALFEQIPESFFSPLASPNRRHYAELLLRYYELFLEYHSSVERAVVVDAFAEYLSSLSPAELVEEEEGTDGASPGAEARAQGSPAPEPERDPRGVANRFLRRLCAYGWMEEEELLDFTRVVNLRDTARPFLEALYQVSRGSAVEYESHVVAIYSSLGSDAADESGEHAVLNAHMHTRLLLESLKLLDQNIRGHLQRIFAQDATVPELLHAHYDVYMHEVIDRAYTRLKTSDNLSRYRPRINKRISAFLKDEEWLRRTAERLSVIKRLSAESAREELRRMLVEVKNDLQSIDPLLERIDDRNRRYSRISTERIRSHIHADQSVAGRLARVARAWADGEYPPGAGPESLVHTIHRLRHLSSDSLYTRRARLVAAEGLQRPAEEPPEAEIVERELLLRARKQLSPAKIAAFLAEVAPGPGDRARAESLVEDLDSYIKLLYAGAYAEGREESFPYQVEWGEELLEAGRYRFLDHTFVRRFPRG